MNRIDRAKEFRAQINGLVTVAAPNLDDTALLEFTALYRKWVPGESYEPGEPFTHEGQLYQVAASATVVAQAHQIPGGTGMLAVYRPIVKGNAGTREDPIPWVYGMDCAKGLYYLYESKTWFCKGDMKPCTWYPGQAGVYQWEVAK